MTNNKNGLTSRHLTMMALGTVIGASFFLGSSVAIQSTGPSIILSYMISGVFVYYILFALSEMTVSIETTGSFRSFASEYVSEGCGFVVGWVYWTGMVISMSSEATAVSLIIKQRFPNVSLPLLGSIIIIAITLINLLGAKQLSQLEGALSAIKLFAIIAFILIGFSLITGLFFGTSAIGNDILASEPFFQGGITNFAGSMLIVLLTYSGFEVIGLAASETKDKQKTIPRAIHYTVFSLLILYILCIGILLLLIPTSELKDDISPLVSALNRYQLTWAGTAMNLILISAILSTMLAAMFGIGRMIRSLVEDGLGPHFLKDTTEVPYRGILFSGFIMLVSLFIGTLFPKAYLFLISSGGFALIFTYIILMITHIRFRKTNGKPNGSCRLRGFPYSSFFTLIGLFAILASMPLISGQAAGFFAGILLLIFYTASYGILNYSNKRKLIKIATGFTKRIDNHSFLTELSEELQIENKKKK